MPLFWNQFHYLGVDYPEMKQKNRPANCRTAFRFRFTNVLTDAANKFRYQYYLSI